MFEFIYLQGYRKCTCESWWVCRKEKEESKKEPEDYRRFFFIDNLSDTSVNRKTISTNSSIATKLEIFQTESQGPELQTKATELIATESIATKPEKPEPEVEPQEDNNASHSKGNEPVLAKYVRRHHTPYQIIRDKYEGTMTRSKLKCTCLLADCWCK